MSTTIHDPATDADFQVLDLYQTDPPLRITFTFDDNTITLLGIWKLDAPDE